VNKETEYLYVIDYADLEQLRIELKEYPPGSKNYKVHIRIWFRTSYDGDWRPGKGVSLHRSVWYHLAQHAKTIDKSIKATVKRLGLDEE
jgi:hypothetical protein